MKTDKSPLPYEQPDDSSHITSETTGNAYTDFEDVADHQMGTQLRRSQRAKNPPQTDQTTPSPVIRRAKRLQCKATNISYALSSSDDSIASEFPDVSIETWDAGSGLGSRSHSPANLIISHGREAATTKKACQSADGVVANRKSLQNTSKQLYSGSTSGKSKNNWRNGAQETSCHGKLIYKHTCLNMPFSHCLPCFIPCYI